MKKAELAADKHFWANRTPELREYYDNEWGVPSHDDRYLFELLIMEIASSGLNWQMALRKRAALNAAFANSDIDRIAVMTDADVERLMQDAGIVRNRRKIESIIANARGAQKIIAEWGSLDHYIWHFTDGQQVLGHRRDYHDVTTQSDLSKAVSKGLKRYGFKFVGPVIMYSYLQGAGVINDRIETDD